VALPEGEAASAERALVESGVPAARIGEAVPPDPAAALFIVAPAAR